MGRNRNVAKVKKQRRSQRVGLVGPGLPTFLKKLRDNYNKIKMIIGNVFQSNHTGSTQKKISSYVSVKMVCTFLYLSIHRTQSENSIFRYRTNPGKKPVVSVRARPHENCVPSECGRILYNCSDLNSHGVTIFAVRMYYHYKLFIITIISLLLAISMQSRRLSARKRILLLIN